MPGSSDGIPWSRADDIAAFGLPPAATIEEAFDDADVVVIQNNHECFARVDLTRLSARMKRPGLIYDFWNQHNARTLTLAPDVTYHGLCTFAVGEAAFVEGAR